MELEDRLLKLEAENIVQAELIRAVFGMLPAPDRIGDAPISVALEQIGKIAGRSPEPLKKAIQGAAADLNPLRMWRRKTDHPTR